MRAAHRDTHFALLKDIRVGDVIEAAGKDDVKLAYHVDRMPIVDADKFTITMGHHKTNWRYPHAIPLAA